MNSVCRRIWAESASAVSRKFDPRLTMQGIPLNVQRKGRAMPVPVTPEAMDAAGAISIGRVAGASQRLPFEDTEPDFDLIQPRGMQRQKLEVHPARLQAEPRANFGSS